MNSKHTLFPSWIKIIVLHVFLGCILSTQSFGQTNTWDGSSNTNWNTAANWSENQVPTSSHDVVIPDLDVTIIVDTDAVCNTLSIESGTETTTLSISGGNSLSVSGNTFIGTGVSPGGFGGAFADIQKVLAVNGESFTCGSLTLEEAGFNKSSRLTISTGTANVLGDISMGDGIGTTVVQFTAAGTLNIEGNISGGAIIPSTGTTNITGNNQSIEGYNFNVLNFNNSGDASIVGSINVDGDLTINSVGSIDFGTNTHNLAGDWSNDAGSLNLTNSTIVLDGAAQSIGGTNSTSFNDLSLAGSGTKSFTISTTIAGTLGFESGVVANLGTITSHTCNALAFENVGQSGGTWGSTSSAAANQNDTFFAATTGVITAAIDGPTTFYSRQTGNWNSAATWSTVTYGDATNNSGTFPQSGDIVNIGGATTITVNIAGECGTLNFRSDDGGNSPVLTISGTNSLDVSGTITIPRGGTFFDGSTNTLAVATGSLSAENIAMIGGSASGTNALTVSTGSIVISEDLTSDNNDVVAIFGGVTNLTFTGSASLQVGGSFFNSPQEATFTPSTGTIEYNGADQNVTGFTYNNLIFSGSGNKSATGIIDVNGNLTLSSGQTFVPGSFEHTIAGNWINNGAGFSTTGSTIIFDGGTQSIGGSSATTFNNLTISANSTTTFDYQTIINATLSINGTGGNEGVADLNDIVTHSAKTLAFDGAGQIPGTWGFTTSGATNTDGNYFASNGIIDITNTIYFSRANGDWNNNASWSTDNYGGVAASGFPVAGDIARIGNDNTITVTADANCAFVEFETGFGNTNTVTINGSTTLTVSESVVVGGLDGDINTMNVDAGTLNASNFIFNPDDAGTVNAELSISTGRATISNDLVHSGTLGFFDLKQAAYITFSGSGLLQLAGEGLSSADCNLTAGTGTIEYNGNNPQVITDFTYYNLTLNNTSSDASPLTAAGDITVTQSVFMSSGIVNLDGNTFTLGSGGTSILFRTPSTTTNWFYNGSFGRYWPASTAITSTSGSHYGLMPVGSETDYRPIEFNSTVAQTGAGEIAVTHTHRTSVTELSPYYDDGGTDIEVKDNSSFVVTNTSTGGTYDVSVSMTGYGGGDVSHIRLAKNSGSTSVSAVGTHVAATGTSTEPTANRSGVSSAELVGDWRVTSSDIANTPLPVDLIRFVGTFNQSQVELLWETTSEIDNDYFELERSFDGIEFNVIAKIEGAGTTAERQQYQYNDRGFYTGKTYYRLKQFDFDGVSETFEIITVQTGQNLESSLILYPNPVKDKLQINLNDDAGLEYALVTILDYSGAIVYKEELKATENSWQIENLDQHLKPGLYIFSLTSGNMKITRKLLFR